MPMQTVGPNTEKRHIERPLQATTETTEKYPKES